MDAPTQAQPRSVKRLRPAATPWLRRWGPGLFVYILWEVFGAIYVLPALPKILAAESALLQRLLGGGP